MTMRNKPLPLTPEIIDTLERCEVDIKNGFYKQPLHDLLRFRIPDDPILPFFIYEVPGWDFIEKDYIRQFLLSRGVKEDVKELRAAFQRADIEAVVRITGRTYHDVWASFADFKLEGRTRRIDEEKIVEVGDIIKIEIERSIAGSDRKDVASWIVRITGIVGRVASVDLLEQLNAGDCPFARKTLHLDCLEVRQTRKAMSLKAERLRRKDEKPSRQTRFRRHRSFEYRAGA
jgi:hypothetical protein